jgi:hypothetical protein
MMRVNVEQFEGVSQLAKSKDANVAKRLNYELTFGIMKPQTLVLSR